MTQNTIQLANAHHLGFQFPLNQDSRRARFEEKSGRQDTNRTFCRRSLDPLARYRLLCRLAKDVADAASRSDAPPKPI
jgi:hypothetical protein